VFKFKLVVLFGWLLSNGGLLSPAWLSIVLILLSDACWMLVVQNLLLLLFVELCIAHSRCCTDDLLVQNIFQIPLSLLHHKMLIWDGCITIAFLFCRQPSFKFVIIPLYRKVIVRLTNFFH